MQRSFQLSIRHLFYATALIASGLAVHPTTLFFSILVLSFWLLVFSDRKPQKLKVVHVILVSAALWGVLVVFLPMVQVSRAQITRVSCENNMRQIMIALHNYDSVHQHLPPAQIIDEATGKPIHSWRVLILPYIEGQAIFDQYDFDEPWNGLNNSKLAHPMPSVFACPYHYGGNGMTTYKLVSDTGAAFDGDKTTRLADIDDGLSTTIALVEDIKNPVNWMKPDDVDIETAIKILTQEQTHHVQEETFRRLIFGTHCYTLDGAVGSLDPNSIAKRELRSWTSLDYGKGEFSITSADTRFETKWGAYLGLVIYIVLAIVPAFFAIKQNTLKTEPTIGAEP